MAISILIFTLIILIISAIMHEVSHGYAAYYLGDSTAKYAGRLSLNPLRHLDAVGSVLMPLLLVISRSPILFGWAKPVPINPYNFRDQKYGSAKVSLAGPGANLMLALIFGLLSRLLPLSLSVKENIVLSYFKEDVGSLLSFLQGNFLASFFLIFSIIVFINVLLAVFNLLPIPPLDGSHILFTFLPPSMNNVKIFLSQYGFFILFFLLFFFPLFFYFLNYIVSFIFSVIIGFPLN